jgi:hypothetical protein
MRPRFQLRNGKSIGHRSHNKDFGAPIKVLCRVAATLPKPR